MSLVCWWILTYKDTGLILKIVEIMHYQLVIKQRSYFVKESIKICGKARVHIYSTM